MSVLTCKRKVDYSEVSIDDAHICAPFAHVCFPSFAVQGKLHAKDAHAVGGFVVAPADDAPSVNI